MCGEILASLSCTTVELLIFVYISCVAICRRSLHTRTAAGCACTSVLSVQLAGRIVSVQIGILVLVARSLCYYDGEEASFVF